MLHNLFNPIQCIDLNNPMGKKNILGFQCVVWHNNNKAKKNEFVQEKFLFVAESKKYLSGFKKLLIRIFFCQSVIYYEYLYATVYDFP